MTHKFTVPNDKVLSNSFGNQIRTWRFLWHFKTKNHNQTKKNKRINVIKSFWKWESFGKTPIFGRKVVFFSLSLKSIEIWIKWNHIYQLYNQWNTFYRSRIKWNNRTHPAKFDKINVFLPLLIHIHVKLSSSVNSFPKAAIIFGSTIREFRLTPGSNKYAKHVQRPGYASTWINLPKFSRKTRKKF